MFNSNIFTEDPVINTLEINYYDPYGNKVGTHFHERNISDMNLKEVIDSNIPKNYQVVPHFAYPDSFSEEIMIAVKPKI